jgi:hypothetical protein
MCSRCHPATNAATTKNKGKPGFETGISRTPCALKLQATENVRYLDREERLEGLLRRG